MPLGAGPADSRQEGGGVEASAGRGRHQRLYRLHRALRLQRCDSGRTAKRSPRSPGGRGEVPGVNTAADALGAAEWGRLGLPSSDVAESTWETVAVPILEAVDRLQREQGGAPPLRLAEIAEEAGLTIDQVDAEIDLLVTGGWLGYEVVRMSGGKATYRLNHAGVYEKGARIIGRWPPDDPFDALLEMLDARLAEEGLDEDTRTKLERFRGGLLDVGKNVAGGVLTALVRAGVGL